MEIGSSRHVREAQWLFLASVLTYGSCGGHEVGGSADAATGDARVYRCIVPAPMTDGAAIPGIQDAAGIALEGDATEVVYIGTNQTGTTIEQAFTVTNEGNAFELNIERVELTGDPAWQCWDESGLERCANHNWRAVVPLPWFQLRDAACTLAEKLRVRFTVSDAQPRAATLTIHFRPEAYVYGQATVVLHLEARP